MDNTTKRSPSMSAKDELLAVREVAREKQAKAAQPIKEAEEAMAEIARLAGFQSQRKPKRGEKSPSPVPDASSPMLRGDRLDTAIEREQTEKQDVTDMETKLEEVPRAREDT